MPLPLLKKRLRRVFNPSARDWCMGRCERCRAEFVSGASYGGHDYCMTCYAKARQDDETKRQQVEQLKQDKIEYRKQQLREEYAAQDRERDKLMRKAAEENKRQDIFDERKRREDQMNEMRKRATYGLRIGRGRAVGEERQVFTPLDRKKKPAAAQEPPASDGGRATLAAMVRRKPEAAKKGRQQPLPALPGLELSVKSALPGTLLPGQAAEAILIGRNASASPLTVSLLLAAADSQQGAIGAKAEPRTCTIAPDESAEIKASISVPQGAAQGKALLTAILKENAIYIDKRSAQSNALEVAFAVKGKQPR